MTDELLIPSGESEKTLAAVETIIGKLYDMRITRSDCVIGVGGGILGDIAGFAAAVYLRGVGFISVPTTLIAAADSAYGGKVGVNFRGGKNHIGCFHDPKAVVLDTDFLSTLPDAELSNGMGEVIKYGVIAEPFILDSVSGRVPSDDIIAKCVDIKRAYVQADPFDRGERHVLNFGHTYGHAIEEAYSYSIPHGQAVAYGMLAAIRLGEALNVTDRAVFPRVELAIKKAGLDTRYEDHLPDSFCFIARDKKSDGAFVDAVLIKEAGKPIRMRLAHETLINRQLVLPK